MAACQASMAMVPPGSFTNQGCCTRYCALVRNPPPADKMFLCMLPFVHDGLSANDVFCLPLSSTNSRVPHKVGLEAVEREHRAELADYSHNAPTQLEASAQLTAH